MRFPTLLSAVLVLTACGSKPKPAAEVGADSAAALPAASGVSTAPVDTARRDSIAPVADSVAPNPAAVTAPDSKATTKTPAKATAPSKIIGRDSAFGPMGQVDASGKITPLPTKKP
jgi:hypothetical protein